MPSSKNTQECSGRLCADVRREYNGELRQRLSVASLKPVSYVEESRRMVQALDRLRAA